MQEIKFTLDQVQQLLNSLSEIPLKYSMGTFNFVQDIAQTQLREAQLRAEQLRADQVPPQAPPTPAE